MKRSQKGQLNYLCLSKLKWVNGSAFDQKLNV